jgi:hypothetical protein
MARGKNNPLESSIDRMTHLPWWVGVVAALLSGLVLHGLVRALAPGSMDFSGPQQATLAAVRGLATGLQILLPAVLLAAAAASAWVTYRHRRNYAAVARRSCR